MTKKVLIVGGGLAGTIVANGLCRQLGEELRGNEVSITMLGATETHMYQPGLLYVPFGRIREKELFRDQRKILDRRVTFHVDPAKNIDVDKQDVATESGKSFGYAISSSPPARASGPTACRAWRRARTGSTISTAHARCATRSRNSRAARS